MLNPSHVLFREDEYLLREDPRVTDEAAYYSLLQAVVDLYDVSDDWVPIYDRTDLDGFYVAIGTSGNQYKNGPVAGHVMAELITVRFEMRLQHLLDEFYLRVALDDDCDALHGRPPSRFICQSSPVV